MSQNVGLKRAFFTAKGTQNEERSEKAKRRGGIEKLNTQNNRRITLSRQTTFRTLN